MGTQGIKTRSEQQRTLPMREVLAVERTRLSTFDELELTPDLDGRELELPRKNATKLELIVERPESPASPASPRTSQTKPSDVRILPGQHRCPEIAGAENERPLLRQIIDGATCDTRQRDGYHKCPSCVHLKLPSFTGSGLPALDNCPSRLAETRIAELKRTGTRNC